MRRAARLILVLNTGSSSVKFALYDRGTDDGDERRVFRDESPRGDDAVDRIIDQLDSATRESLLDQYVEALRRTLGVVVHPEVLQSAEGS